MQAHHKGCGTLRLGGAALLGVLCQALLARADPLSAPSTIRPFACRIQEGANADLFVMTLGDVETPIADGTFDPAKDQVTLQDGTVKTNYYRDVLGLKYFQPLDKSRFPLPPSGWCTWYYYYSRISAVEVKRNADWIAANLKDLFTRLSAWGYEYFKIDGQPTVVDEYRASKQFMKDPSEDAEGLYRQTLESIRGAIGPDRYLLGCWGIPTQGAGIMNGARTGGDIVLGWGGFQVALRATLEQYYLHNVMWYSDPDVLLVRSPLSLDQARVWSALQGLTGQALLSSDRLMDLSEQRVDLLRRVYPAVDIRPLDLFPAQRNKRIWDLKINHLSRRYDVVGVFNFNEGKSEHTFLSWKDLGLPGAAPIHVFDFWTREYLGAWSKGMMIETAPTSCRLLTLLPANDRIQLISTSRHITQGWVDLAALNQSESGDSFTGASKLIKNDIYELRFVFPRGTNFVVKTALARDPSGDLPVKILNHQGWAAVRITSPQTALATWEVQFEPADFYHYPVAEPNNFWIEQAGLDAVNVHWREQYYLNAGYQVYLNGALAGYSPDTTFALRGLDPQVGYTVAVKTVWQDGKESARNGELKFTLASLLPGEWPVTQLEPLRSNARWRGIEAADTVPGAPLSLGNRRHQRGLGAAPNSEIEYDIRGLYHTFSALVGIDNASRSDPGLEFLVLGDGKELWHSGVLKKSDEPQRVEADITAVKKLVLRVNGATGRRFGVQADWVEPKLIRRTAEEISTAKQTRKNQ